ncbi:hypothetical protein GALL_473230 [mine drainage metagenome]|uniref:Uncharacterized protein n=1 Tax=mine drainage metagenome TaxID=410659 RepID=A0A1J5Q569_9ZZZZ
MVGPVLAVGKLRLGEQFDDPPKRWRLPDFANDLWPGVIRPDQVLQERPFEEDVVGELHGMSVSDRSNDAIRLEFGERLSIDIGYRDAPAKLMCACLGQLHQGMSTVAHPRGVSAVAAALPPQGRKVYLRGGLRVRRVDLLGKHGREKRPTNDRANRITAEKQRSKGRLGARERLSFLVVERVDGQRPHSA